MRCKFAQIKQFVCSRAFDMFVDSRIILVCAFYPKRAVVKGSDSLCWWVEGQDG